MAPRNEEDERSEQYGGSPDDHRKKLVWESLLGFVGFFAFLALIQAIWNVFQEDPAILPSVLLLVLAILTWLMWRHYRQF